MTELLCPEVAVSASMNASSKEPSYLGDTVTYTCQDRYALYEVENAEQTISCIPGEGGPVWDSEVFECQREYKKHIRVNSLLKGHMGNCCPLNRSNR